MWTGCRSGMQIDGEDDELEAAAPLAAGDDVERDWERGGTTESEAPGFMGHPKARERARGQATLRGGTMHVCVP